MKKGSKALTLVACVFALVLCAGCGSSAASSSAAASDQSASATAASAASAASAAGAGAGALDPANLADGEYQIGVQLEGGSGKAYIESPAKLIVEDGQLSLIVVWSSENYDQMVVDGQQYFPVPRPGNSTFQIPVPTVEESLPVQAETTAMSEPHMIDYVIHFDTATLM